MKISETFIPSLPFPSWNYFDYWLPVWLLGMIIGTELGWIFKSL
jgi:hypothetical protein